MVSIQEKKYSSGQKNRSEKVSLFRAINSWTGKQRTTKNC